MYFNSAASLEYAKRRAEAKKLKVQQKRVASRENILCKRQNTLSLMTGFLDNWYQWCRVLELASTVHLDFFKDCLKKCRGKHMDAKELEFEASKPTYRDPASSELQHLPANATVLRKRKAAQVKTFLKSYHTHVCSPTCLKHVSRDVMFCIYTSNVHICNLSQCCQLNVKSLERGVRCPFSGNGLSALVSDFADDPVAVTRESGKNVRPSPAAPRSRKYKEQQETGLYMFSAFKQACNSVKMDGSLLYHERFHAEQYFSNKWAEWQKSPISKEVLLSKSDAESFDLFCNAILASFLQQEYPKLYDDLISLLARNGKSKKAIFIKVSAWINPPPVIDVIPTAVESRANLLSSLLLDNNQDEYMSL